MVCNVCDYFIIQDRYARILMYHTFTGDFFFTVKKNLFETQILYLKKRGYIFLTLSELVDRIEKTGSIEKCIVVSVDDGHADFVTAALPIIEKYNIPVTLFWPTGITALTLSTGQVCAILSKDSIAKLATHPLIELGSHSVTHRELPTLSSDTLRAELKESLETIREMTNTRVALGYPRGKYSPSVIAATRAAGYYAACTVIPGVVTNTTDTYALPRLSIDQETDMRAFKAKFSWLYALYAIVRS